VWQCVSGCLMRAKSHRSLNWRPSSAHAALLGSISWLANAQTATQHDVHTARRQKYKLGRDARPQEQPTARLEGNQKYCRLSVCDPWTHPTSTGKPGFLCWVCLR
jgi:hypothetical protein